MELLWALKAFNFIYANIYDAFNVRERMALCTFEHDS